MTAGSSSATAVHAAKASGIADPGGVSGRCAEGAGGEVVEGPQAAQRRPVAAPRCPACRRPGPTPPSRRRSCRPAGRPSGPRARGRGAFGRRRSPPRGRRGRAGAARPRPRRKATISGRPSAEPGSTSTPGIRGRRRGRSRIAHVVSPARRVRTGRARRAPPHQDLARPRVLAGDDAEVEEVGVAALAQPGHRPLDQPAPAESLGHADLADVADALLPPVHERPPLGPAADPRQTPRAPLAGDDHVAGIAHDRRAQEVVRLAGEADRDRAGHRRRADQGADVRLVVRRRQRTSKASTALAHRRPRRMPCFLKASRRKSGL